MAEIPSPGFIFQPRLNTGAIAADAVTIIGQGTHINKALAQAIGSSTAAIIDTVNISAGAKLADDLHAKEVALTGASSPVEMKGVHPIINGIANLSKGAKELANGK